LPPDREQLLAMKILADAHPVRTAREPGSARVCGSKKLWTLCRRNAGMKRLTQRMTNNFASIQPRQQPHACCCGGAGAGILGSYEFKQSRTPGGGDASGERAGRGSTPAEITSISSIVRSQQRDGRGAL